MHTSCLIAFDDEVVRSWARYGVRAAGLRPRDVRDRAGLFEALAGEPAALVIGATFDLASVAATLAAIRTAGCELVTVVVAAGANAPRLWARFGMIATLDGALDSRALAGALHEVLRPRAIWAALEPRTAA